MSDTDTDESTPVVDELRDEIVARLRADLGDAVVDVHQVPQVDLWVRVTPESWRAAGEALRAQGFDYFCFLSAMDWMPSPFGDGENDPTEEVEEEMFGISFDGHPDLRNMYLPGDFEGYPLRKDFPLLARLVKPWPGIVDVEPMPASDNDEGDDS